MSSVVTADFRHLRALENIHATIPPLAIICEVPDVVGLPGKIVRSILRGAVNNFHAVLELHVTKVFGPNNELVLEDEKEQELSYVEVEIRRNGRTISQIAHDYLRPALLQ